MEKRTNVWTLRTDAGPVEKEQLIRGSKSHAPFLVDDILDVATTAVALGDQALVEIAGKQVEASIHPWREFEKVVATDRTVTVALTLRLSQKDIV